MSIKSVTFFVSYTTFNKFNLEYIKKKMSDTTWKNERVYKCIPSVVYIFSSMGRPMCNEGVAIVTP